MHATDFSAKSLIRTMPRPMRRMIAPIFVIMFCFCAICAYVLYDARRNTLERAAEVATSMVAAITADISRNVEVADLSLQGVADNLTFPGIDRMKSDLRNIVLFDRSVAARHLGKIVVIDEKGNTRFDSKILEPRPVNLSDRDYFQAHKANAKIGLHISRPTISPTDGYLFVALSRRLSHQDGSFAGVAAASLRLSYFEQLFKNFTLGPDSTVTLSRSDGMVLMRWPFKQEYIGLDLSHAKLHHELARSRAGHFETYSATDELHRLIVYSQVDDLPLVVAVGQSTANIYAQWYEYAFIIAFMLALVCIMTVLATTYLTHELGRRKEAEAKLAELAATDALTSLSNRRHFNETFAREWQRAMRDQDSLSLLMLDVDKFKTFNDARGHQAGDSMLKILGAAIAAAIKRGGDVGARFGGDEFAILLPGTAIDGATRVAEKIRESFVQYCKNDDFTPLGLSIGVACVKPDGKMGPRELVELADAAFYRAKNLGRNRTEVAATIHAGPAAATKVQSHKAA